jgi:serine/threonine protein kinase
VYESQRIARGTVPLDEALPVARQIAQALETAHEQGIIHRDLKPANIKVRGDGAVKVLDFGLAKAVDPAAASAADGANSPTLTAHATALGIILGTVAYMAPEQAKGKPVDKRADIWAFGVVLFEMLSGRAAFQGDTVTDIIAAVVTREPDWTLLPATTPASIRRLLARRLEKDPKRRLRDIGDARFEIDETIARGSSDAGATDHVPRPSPDLAAHDGGWPGPELAQRWPRDSGRYALRAHRRLSRLDRRRLLVRPARDPRAGCRGSGAVQRGDAPSFPHPHPRESGRRERQGRDSAFVRLAGCVASGQVLVITVARAG